MVQNIKKTVTCMITRLKNYHVREKHNKLLNRILDVFTSPFIGVAIFAELCICFGMITLLESISLMNIIISVCCFAAISALTTYALMKKLSRNRRAVVEFIILAGGIFFFVETYVPETYNVRPVLMLTLFVISFFMIYVRKTWAWMVYVLTLAGGLMDLRYFFVSLIPIILFEYVVRNTNHHYILSNRDILINVVLAFLMGAVRIFGFHDRIADILFQVDVYSVYPFRFLGMLGIAYMTVILLWNDSVQKLTKTVIPIVCISVLLILQGFTDSGYLYGVMLTISLLLAMVQKIGHKKKIEWNDFYCNRKALLIVWALLIWFKYIMELHLDSPLWFGRYAIAHYYVDYVHYGFVQRGLIGTLFYFILGYYVPPEKMVIVVDVVYFVVLGIAMYLLYRLYRKGNSQNKRVVWLLFMLLFISPALGGYMDDWIVQSIDVYNLLCSVICISLIVWNRFLFFVPLLCTVGMLTHQIFVFTCFPMIFSALLYRAYIEDNGKSRYNRCIFYGTCAIVFGLFIFIQFYSQQFLKIDMDTAIHMIRQRSGGKKLENLTLLDSVIFTGMSEHLTKFHTMISGTSVRNIILTVLYASPLFVLYGRVFYESAYQEEKKGKKVAYFIIGISMLAILPCYILETDYNRWTTALFLTALMNILTVTLLQKEEKQWFRNMDAGKLETWMFIAMLLLGIYRDMRFSLY